MDKPNHFRKRMGLVLIGVMLLATSCGGSSTLLGYAVAHSDQGVLIIEKAAQGGDASGGSRSAVWVRNLHKNQVGNLLRVELTAMADSYPASSSSRKTTQQPQLKGERSVLAASFEYAITKWEGDFPSINSVTFDKERSEWEIALGNIFDENEQMKLIVSPNKEIMEVELDEDLG